MKQQKCKQGKLGFCYDYGDYADLCCVIDAILNQNEEVQNNDISKS